VKRLFLAFLAALFSVGLVHAQVPAPVLAPAPPVDPQNLWHLQLSTGGEVVIQLRPDKAPGHVARYKTLTRAGFYDGLLFHRVVDGFMAQTGDPKATGEGGSPLPDLTAEFNDLPHMRGTVSAARTDQPNTANSQFFIVFSPTLRLDGKYTAFGRVLSGMQYVDAITRGQGENGAVIQDASKIIHAWIEADGPNAGRVPLDVAAETAKAKAIAEAAPAPATVVAAAPEPKRKKKKRFGIF
jgi:cyclophilin family peptidyl-prolyl cis-trans isomerase